jgi:hypothetical protein
MRVVRGLVQEEIVDDHAFHGRQRGRDVRGVGVGPQNVLALHLEALEAAVDRGVEHVGDAQPRLLFELDLPHRLEGFAHLIGRDVPVTRRFMRETSPCRRNPARRAVHADAGRPILPVAMARLAIAITVVEPWLCSVTPKP